MENGSARRALGVVVVWAILSPSMTLAQALPRSMVELVKHSDFIGDIRLGPAKDGKMLVKLVESLKGGPPKGELSIDLTEAHEAHRDMVQHWLREFASLPGMLFSGRYPETTHYADGREETNIIACSFLHFGRWWADLEWNEKAGQWDFLTIRGLPGGGWENETALLLDCVRYILAAGAKAEWPLDTRIESGPVVRIGAMPGKVHGLAAVDLTGDGRWTLLLAGDGGDRAFEADCREKISFRDATGSLKLASRSQFVVFADFNADGRLDLASCAGRSLTIWVQSREGTFETKLAGVELPAEAIGLAVLDVGRRGQAALVVSTPGLPLLATWGKDGMLSVRPLVKLPAGTTQPADLAPPHRAEPFGLARPCVVADLDGDAIADVLQPFERGGLFYKGGGAGVFELPRSCASPTVEPRWVYFRDRALENTFTAVRQRPGTIYSSEGPANVRLGDFDADGRLDILLLPRESEAFQWRNCGAGIFDGPMRMGQIAYIGSSGASASVGDQNNDGREDILFTSPTYEPTVHFAQGFGMFQWGGGVREEGVEDENGHQAGLLVDVSGDGRQDIVLVKAGGDVILVPQKAQKTNGLGVRAVLPAAGGFAGPLVVVGWDGDRCLGARVAKPGGEAFFGRRSPGEVTVKWRYPGRPAQQARVTTGTGPVRVLLGPDGVIDSGPVPR